MVRRPSRSATESRKLGPPHRAGGEHGRLEVVLPPSGRAHALLDLSARARAQPCGVAEELHAVGRLLEERGGEPAAAQRVGQALGGAPLVAQHLEIPVGGAEFFADLAEGEEAGVGVGLVREPAEHRRQQLALDGGASADALGEGLQVPEGTLGVAETQCGEPLLGCLGCQADLGLREPGDGGEERAIEDPLVQATHLTGGRPPLRDDLGRRVGRVAQGAPQSAQVPGGRRDQVRASHPLHLDAVLEGAQEPIGRGQGRGVLPTDIAATGQGLQRRDRRAGAQGLVRAAVDQLEQLDGELDVTQSALAELELSIGLGGGHVVLDAAAHGLRVGDEVVAPGGRPDEGVHGLDIGLPDLGVTGDGA